MKHYRISVKHHRPGIWVKPENNPMFGLFKIVPTGCHRVKMARQYDKKTATWRFATYLKRPDYFLDIVETAVSRTKPEPWEDTNLA